MATYEILSPFPSGDKRKSLAVQRGFAAFRKLVVVRKILEDVRNDQPSFQALLRDAKIVAVFSHPNIADLYDLDVLENELLLVTEFVPGASLAEVRAACRRANQKVPLEVTLRVLQHAAMALHYAHTFVDPSGRPMGVVHKHVNDDALVLSFDGLTKVTDFCAPRSVAPEASPDPFRAPEYARDDRLDGRADIYSLGVLLQRALADARQPVPGAAGAAIPQALDAVVARATARTRDQRFAQAFEFARACETAAGRGWEPAQLAAFMQRLFQDRRAKMAELVSLVEVKEATTMMKLSDIFEGGTSTDAASAISEATKPRAKSPYVTGDAEDAIGTTPFLRPPPTIGLAAPVRMAPPVQPEKLRLGRALFKLVAWVVLLGGTFCAGAYVMDPARVRVIAHGMLQSGSKLGALPEGPVLAATDSAPGVGSAGGQAAVVSLEDAGSLPAETSPAGMDAGLEENPVDAGTAEAQVADAGARPNIDSPWKRRRR